MLSPGTLATAALLIGAIFLPLSAPRPASAQAPSTRKPAERKPKDFVARADQARDRAGIYKFQSGAYRITTDVDKDLANDIAAHMDEVYKEYASRLSGFKPNPYAAVKPNERMPLYVLRTYKDYLALLEGFGVNGTNSGGVFFRTENRQSGLATWVEGQSRLKMYYILQHEGFHQFADARIMFGLPPWVNEGLAEYFGDAVMVDRELVAGKLDRERIERMRRAVKDGDTLPFATLLNMTNDAWLGRVNAGDRGAALQYDTAWAVCYYLIHGGKAGKPLRTKVRGADVGALEAYLLILNDSFVRNPAGDPRPAAFKEVFSDNLKGFEAAWKEGLNKLEPDAWFTSVRHLQFIAAGVRKFHGDGVAMTGWEDVKATMARRQFRTTIRERDAAGKDAKAPENNVDADADGAGDAEPKRAAQRYEFPNPAEVEFIPSTDPKLPPGLLVKNITPNIRLSWKLSTAGDVEEVITFSDPPKVAKKPEGRRTDNTAAKPVAPRGVGPKSAP